MRFKKCHLGRKWEVFMKFVMLFVVIFFTLKVRADFLPSSFSANFTQEYVSTLKGKVKKGNGTVDYKYPGNIRFETNNPTHVLFVSNGKKNWYYSFPFIEGEEGELTESSGKDSVGFFTKFFDSLKNGLKSNQIYSVENNKNETSILFKNKFQKEVGLKTAKLIFLTDKMEFNNIERIELEFLDLKKSTMKLSEIKLNPTFDSEKFNFIPPKNTKLMKR